MKFLTGMILNFKRKKNMSDKAIAVLSFVFMVLAWSALIVDIFHLVPLYSKVVFYLFCVCVIINTMTDCVGYYLHMKDTKNEEEEA